MSFTDERIAAPAPIARAPWEQCDSCQAPVDDTQRYCVACGAHQRRSNDPAARFFADARRPKTPAVPAPEAGSRRTVPTIVAAGLIALLPVAAGIGILVGRGASSNDDVLVEALKAQKVEVVQVGGGAAGATGDAAATGDEEASADASASDKDETSTSSKPAKILATGPAGSARQLAGTKPTKKDVEESKKAVERINSTKGDEYVDSQRDLPDQIVVP
ncbi:zinc ribbon domain-containing protein [Svornostia abyssi]|uniref:Zinc ribbon domain-containing protein n=1 Tax=Svornostia abyssi TaxID=2898438 RepID=A0ABY5PL11_9ACTN|nr:zinc ribbon domain-containing protein [Parviterribacteraceae bacterium J379]